MADSWRISLDDDKIESLFSVDLGISLMIDGGWSEFKQSKEIVNTNKKGTNESVKRHSRNVMQTTKNHSN